MRDECLRRGYQLVYNDTEADWMKHAGGPNRSTNFATSLGFSVRNDGNIGDGAVRHGFLDAIQRAARRRELDRLGRRIAPAFEQRQRADCAARGQQWKPFLLLRLIARHPNANADERAPLELLLDALAHPYDEDGQPDTLRNPPPPGTPACRTFCGT